MNNLRMYFSFILFSFLITFYNTPCAQPLKVKNGAELEMALNKLNVLGSVLYIAAHPDDENTSLIAFLSNKTQVRTAYLSLTRGDGGQNLLGNEKGELLGVLRTQETLAARSIDGGEQFFTRAIDFGYSKTAEETFRNWNRELLLGDIVKVIRQFQPDVIITRFDSTNGGHGHHLVSAILALEAFKAAADPTRFPEQLKELKPWQSKRIFWNTWRPTNTSISMEVGGYNPYLGMSYSEIAARSRSMHKCQGFGVSPHRGERTEQFNLLAGEPAAKGIFDGIDFSWKRVPNSQNVQKLINETREKFDISKPENILPDLVNLYKELERLGDNHYALLKKKEVIDLIRLCSGVWMESIVNKPGTSRGSEIVVNSTVLNRSGADIKLEKISTSFDEKDTVVNASLSYNEPLTADIKCKIPNNADYSQPYWLEEESNGKMFAVPKPELIGKPQNGSALLTTITLNIEGEDFVYDIPVQYKWNDPTEGERYQPFFIRPGLSIKVLQPNYIFPDTKTRSVMVEITAEENNLSGNLIIELPAGWKDSKNYIPFELNDANDKKIFSLEITPTTNAQNGELRVMAKVGNKLFSKEIVEINYPHIPAQIVLKDAKTNLVKLDINYQPEHIGYIMGSGDEIPEALRQLGYTVDLLSDDDLDTKDLSIYKTIICGVRAYNSRDRLATQQKRLNEYVYNGGTWIVQHNTRFGKHVDQIGPYPFDVQGSRIAEENSPITILDKSSPLMNYPNKISEKDFDGWVQERGLYFAESWDKHFTPILSGHDKGESPKEGGLLYARYGKGIFIFTGYSWFRELPAGVPGAYRIFINLISAHG